MFGIDLLTNLFVYWWAITISMIDSGLIASFQSISRSMLRFGNFWSYLSNPFYSKSNQRLRMIVGIKIIGYWDCIIMVKWWYGRALDPFMHWKCNASDEKIQFHQRLYRSILVIIAKSPDHIMFKDYFSLNNWTPLNNILTTHECIRIAVLGF